MFGLSLKPINRELRAINKELAKTAKAYPMDPGEVGRMEKRPWILRHVVPGGIGAEVGVFRGHFSEVLMANLKPEKIYLIDPWTKAGELFDFTDGPYTNLGLLPTKVALNEVQLRARKFPDVDVKIIEGYSVEEMEKIPEKLNFVYIDANHNYEYVLKDLYAAAKLLAPRGVIIGDDWIPHPGGLHHGVFKAVQKFVRATDFQIIGAGYGSQYCLRRAGLYGTPAADMERRLRQKTAIATDR
jgi:hypothetical protein